MESFEDWWNEADILNQDYRNLERPSLVRVVWLGKVVRNIVARQELTDALWLYGRSVFPS